MRATLICLTVILFSASLWCEDAPKTELFAGYSYLNLDTQGLTKRLNLNGWEASGSYNLNNWFGITGDVSGHYKNKCIILSATKDLDCTHLSFMAGPTLSYRNDRTTIFAHGLVGGDMGKFGIGLASASDTNLAFALGGGFDYAATEHVSIQIGPFDYFMTRHGQDAGGTHQNNFRASAGVAFTFGRKHRLSDNDSSAPNVPESRESTSLGAAGYQTSEGFVITLVRAGSRAESIFLKPGDVISSIDDKPVRSRDDVESAITGAKADTVKVSCILTTGIGRITSDRTIKLR